MRQFILSMFVLLLTGGYTLPCFAQTSDQYGELPDEETIQRNYERLQQPLFRFGDMVYLQDDMGEYWIVDTTRVIVHVNEDVMPEDVDWKVDILGFTTVMVPEGIWVKDFALSLWEKPWVVTVSYNSYAKQGMPDYYRPYFQEKKAWKTETDGKEYVHYIEGDTVIGGTYWKKVYSNIDGDDFSYFGAIRQERYKVFAIAKGKDTPHLLYDFSLKVGDKLRCTSEETSYGTFDYIAAYDEEDNGWTMELKSIDKIYVGRPMAPSYDYDREHRAFIFERKKAGESSDVFVWVEGVGSEGGLFHAWCKPTPDSKVSCYMRNPSNQILFDGGDFHLSIETDYRPFIEDDKVWKVGHILKPDYRDCYGMSRYYFDGDTIVGGKAGKRMMCKTDVNEKMGDDLPLTNSLKYVGALREEGRRVYLALPNKENFILLYDFESEVGDSLEAHSEQLPTGVTTTPCTIYKKYHGRLIYDEYGSTTFKGSYEDVTVTQFIQEGGYYGTSTTWMEGVGMDAGPLFGLYSPNWSDCRKRLLSCTAGDEVLYRNTAYVWENEMDPESSCTKRRVDFTHVVKKKPKAPQRRVQENEDVAVSGEYTQTALTIDLATLQDTYAVTITDPSGQSVYAKDVKTNRVLALDIDISTYTEDAYTITLENEDEIFEGNFRLSDLTSIHEVTTPRTPSDVYHDLMGRRVTTPSEGIYIRNGKKVLFR